jgi:hypothetical protein
LNRSNSLSSIVTLSWPAHLSRTTAAIHALGSSARIDTPRAANRRVALPVPAATSSARPPPASAITSSTSVSGYEVRTRS